MDIVGQYKKKKHLRGSTSAQNLGYDGLGEYCGPHTASSFSVFLILLCTGSKDTDIGDILLCTHELKLIFS